MACLNCSLCNLSMEFLEWDETSAKVSTARKEALYDSPVTDVESPGFRTRGGSLIELQVLDDTDDEVDATDLVYNLVETGTYQVAETVVNSSISSEESGFGSENPLNLQCTESNVWWSGETSSRRVEAASPISSPIAKVEKRSVFTGFSEYSTDIYQHRKDVETRTHFTDCLKYQREITPGMRGVLVSWMSKVHQKFQLTQETLFLTVNVVDRCMRVMHVSRDCFQLVGATALLVAGKHEEVTPPEIQDLLWLCGDSYSRDQMRELEKIILEALNFNLFVPTGNFFLEYFAHSEISIRRGREEERLRNARRQARYFLELSLQDYELCQYPPSMLALSAWKAAVRDCASEYQSFPAWETDFQQNIFEECYREFTMFMTRLNQNFPETSALSDSHAYEDVGESDSD